MKKGKGEGEDHDDERDEEKEDTEKKRSACSGGSSLVHLHSTVVHVHTYYSAIRQALCDLEPVAER